MGLFSRMQLGVEIGHTSVKVAAVEVRGSGRGAKARLHGCKQANFDPAALNKEGEIVDVKNIVDTVKLAMKQAAPKPIKGVQALCIAVPETKVFRKVLDLPLFEREEDLAKAVALGLEQFLPEGQREVEVDYQYFGPAEDPSLQQILAVSVPKDLVASYVALAKGLHLPLTAIDTKPSSIARTLIGINEQKPILLLDISTDRITVALHHDQMVRVTSIVNTGSALLADEEGKPLPEGTERDGRIERLVSLVADEASHVLKYWSNRSGSTTMVEEIRLSGSGSMTAGLADQISKEVGLKVNEAKPTIALPPFCDRRFYGAVGSALYGVSISA